ncbi:TetR/AcrR family transcriptional regulator [Nocardia nepalensis]|uniref:TetR/AcrR family transcriptional regulator n=1 Tax=Nocardia nepalensis TaxID=3375448 RepID=UPI003B6831AE
MPAGPFTSKNGGAMAYLTASERRSKIVEAATRVIARDGLAAASTRRIADEAGVNLAALHYSFDGKEDIYLAADDALRAIVMETDHDSPEPPTRHSVARSLISRFQDKLRTDRDIALAQYELLLWALRGGKDELAAASYQKFIDAFSAEFAQAYDIGDSDTTALSRYTIGAIDGIYMQHLAAGTNGVSDVELDAIAHAIITIVDAIRTAGSRRIRGG